GLKSLGIRVRLDARDHLSPGAKFWEWERKGVPFRIEIGPKDLAREQVVLVRRVTFGEESRKEFLPEDQAIGEMAERLDTFQGHLLEQAKERREVNSHRGVNTLSELQEIMDGPGGFVYTGWSGDPAVEELVKEKTRATIRVIPDQEFRSDTPPTRCIGGGEARMEVVWSKAY
ncbi:MAG: His/Gly/Thr/Pro-type tRNA ligase C-terminal domain-containing protein, partial [Gemmatimonadota bacterium]